MVSVSNRCSQCRSWPNAARTRHANGVTPNLGGTMKGKQVLHLLETLPNPDGIYWITAESLVVIVREDEPGYDPVTLRNGVQVTVTDLDDVTMRRSLWVYNEGRGYDGHDQVRILNSS